MEASGHALTGLLLTYPVHQACDILFCKANVVPIGKDNLPHVEITRTIARRFNERYAKKNPVFPGPAAILDVYKRQTLTLVLSRKPVKAMTTNTATPPHRECRAPCLPTCLAMNFLSSCRLWSPLSSVATIMTFSLLNGDYADG